MAPRMVTHGQAPIPAFRTDNFEKSLYYKQNNAREITVGTRHALGGLETWSKDPFLRPRVSSLWPVLHSPVTSVFYPLTTGLDIYVRMYEPVM